MHHRESVQLLDRLPHVRASYNRGMPIYEYECKKCKAHIEVFQKVSDKPPTKCRKCGGKLERKISAPAIQFKGSGWYVTDYAKDNEKRQVRIRVNIRSKNRQGEKTEKKTKESSPAKKTADKPSSPKASTGD